MKSFLLYKGVPTVKFSMIPDGYYYEGKLPSKEYALAICPTDEKQVILDVDVKNGKNGFKYIPKYVLKELSTTFNYATKSGGRHYFLNYTGKKLLKNCATDKGLDLRIGANKKTKNAGGYVKYHYSVDIRKCIPLIKSSSEKMNKWLEKLFGDAT